MSTYNVPAGTSTITETLTASAADTVTFADRARFVSVTNTGTTVLYARADGAAAAIAGQGCIAVMPGDTKVVSNGEPIWFPSSKVIPQGSNQFGGGNTASSPSSPGTVTPMESLAGQKANPGTVVSIISSAADSYTLALAG